MAGADHIGFGRAAGFYEATRAIAVDIQSEAAALLAQDAARDSSLPFLDAGAGTGRLDRHLRAAGVESIGVDISTPMLAEARRLSPACSLVRADVRRVPFPAGSFGGALLVRVLHLIEEWQDAINGLWRVLHAGSAIYVRGQSRSALSDARSLL